MELRQLEYFLKVLDQGGISSAARALGVAQSALSKSLQLLERELGVRLFHRHGRGVRPTREGHLLAEEVRPAIRGLADARAAVSGTPPMVPGKVALGLGATLMSTVGARLIRGFSSRYPQVRLRVEHTFATYLSEMLSSGHVDLAVINQAQRWPYVEVERLVGFDLFLIGSAERMADLGGADGDAFSTPRLAGLPLILLGPTHGIRRELDRTALRLGMTYNVLMEVNAFSVIRDLVEQGVGFTVLPNGPLQASDGSRPLVARRLVEPEIPITFSIARASSRPRTMAMRELTRMLHEEVGRAVAEKRLHGRV